MHVPNHKIYFFHAQSGLSIIEILVGIGILSIVGLAIMTLMSSLQRETRYLQQKLNALDLEKHLIAITADGRVCRRAITDNVYTFDKNDLNNTSLDIPELYSSDDPSAPILIKQNTAISSDRNDLIIDKIIINSLKEIAANRFTGNLMIAFKSDNLQRRLKPIALKQIFSTDPESPDSAKKIVNCSSQSSFVTMTYDTTVHCHTIRLHPPSYQFYYDANDKLNAYGHHLPKDGRQQGEPGNVEFYGTIFYPFKSYPILATANTVGNTVDWAWLVTLGYRHGVYPGFSPTTVSGLVVELVENFCPVIF